MMRAQRETSMNELETNQVIIRWPKSCASGFPGETSLSVPRSCIRMHQHLSATSPTLPAHLDFECGAQPRRSRNEDAEGEKEGPANLERTRDTCDGPVDVGPAEEEELGVQLYHDPEKGSDGVLDAGSGEVVEFAKVDAEDLVEGHGSGSLLDVRTHAAAHLDHARKIRPRLRQLQQNDQQDRDSLPAELSFVEESRRPVRDGEDHAHEKARRGDSKEEGSELSRE